MKTDTKWCSQYFLEQFPRKKYLEQLVSKKRQKTIFSFFILISENLRETCYLANCKIWK